MNHTEFGIALLALLIITGTMILAWGIQETIDRLDEILEWINEDDCDDAR